ncbi:platelet-activating factor acetylhydrolase IB subunit beta/gamma [Rathayibacter oskolensis]|uniref:Platelet-activating factor acetylhydrolase IB subunit beta/gamma n=1 Tax=Rathayibacter oskolensis TaxID=1891671 RepID=A0A1X7NBP0_9MICO|nr:GDSL-type esterase/lipase family protein [Rathayibacter oskolensis]SMH35040.1 platelet-activating factor acetylhydrolase IB subunit beta/gamma [Rathayibacter oskolensis]
MSERSDTDAGRDLQLGKTLFIGDSIIQGGGWDEWLSASTVVDEGVGGATTADVVARLPELIEQAPDTIVLLVGTNDLAWHRTTEHIVRNIETVVATFRRDLPDVRILVISVLPRGHEFAPQIREINRHLWQFAPTAHAGYLDLWPVLAGEDGGILPQYSPDGLHLNEDGYAAWREALGPALGAVLRMPPRTRPITLPFDEFARPKTA